MSNIPKSDVKNHLSPRFRKKIFLSRSDIHPDATSLHEELVCAESEANAPMENALNPSSTNGRKHLASITPGII